MRFNSKWMQLVSINKVKCCSKHKLSVQWRHFSIRQWVLYRASAVTPFYPVIPHIQEQNDSIPHLLSFNKSPNPTPIVFFIAALGLCQRTQYEFTTRFIAAMSRPSSLSPLTLLLFPTPSRLSYVQFRSVSRSSPPSSLNPGGTAGQPRPCAHSFKTP